MNPWRSVRRELAGAWRSLRYDLTARPDPAQHADDRPTVELHLHEPRRRVLPAAALGLLAAGGAAGTYLAVAGGLGALLTDASARPLPQPPWMAPTTAAAAQPPQAATQPAPIVTTLRPAPSTPAWRAPLPAPPTPTPAPTCLCPTPPAPSPTPPGPTPDPTGTPTPTTTVSLPPPAP